MPRISRSFAFQPRLLYTVINEIGAAFTCFEAWIGVGSVGWKFELSVPRPARRAGISLRLQAAANYYLVVGRYLCT
jgi:hypothetical protein